MRPPPDRLSQIVHENAIGHHPGERVAMRIEGRVSAIACFRFPGNTQSRRFLFHEKLPVPSFIKISSAISWLLDTGSNSPGSIHAAPFNKISREPSVVHLTDPPV
jgi:hypothetical protein